MKYLGGLDKHMIEAFILVHSDRVYSSLQNTNLLNPDSGIFNKRMAAYTNVKSEPAVC
jgi:hypothetical protein